MLLLGPRHSGGEKDDDRVPLPVRADGAVPSPAAAHLDMWFGHRITVRPTTDQVARQLDVTNNADG
jgi:hypothetical protein